MNSKKSETTDDHRFSQILELEKFNPITEKIIGCAYTVSNTLGEGFLEKVYENALAHEMQKAGLKVQQQHPVQVQYDGIIVGDYLADILVEDRILLELKAVKVLDQTHQAQCLNYLKASGLHICLLINFGTRKVEIKRFVL
jgi:GxxExxY protein